VPAATPPARSGRSPPGRRLIGGHLNGHHVGRADGSLKEPTSSLRVAPTGHEHFDHLPELVDRAVHLPPLAGDLHLGLVHEPAVANGVPARSGSLGQQRCEPLHPPVDRHVVDLHAPFGEEFLDVAVGQAEARYQRTARTITSDGKRNAVKADRGTGVARGRRVLMPAVWLLEGGHRGCNSALWPPYATVIPRPPSASADSDAFCAS
jgi:hypothetical protein